MKRSNFLSTNNGNIIMPYALNASIYRNVRECASDATLLLVALDSDTPVLLVSQIFARVDCYNLVVELQQLVLPCFCWYPTINVCAAIPHESLTTIILVLSGVLRSLGKIADATHLRTACTMWHAILVKIILTACMYLWLFIVRDCRKHTRLL